jgi:C4-dicarboxylate-specific signal transduction histidine kinase
VRSRLPWLIGLAGLLALLRRRRPRVAVVEHGDPAVDLRRKLDETVVERAAEEQAPAPSAPAEVDERRRQVHDAGRAAVDEMRGPATPEA